MLGGAPDATKPSFEAIARMAEQSAELRMMLELMRSDHDRAQGPGHWKTVIAQTYERITRPHGYSFKDLGRITAPTLILVGDRDPFCTVEEGATACRALSDGEFAVLPGTGHVIDAAAVRTTIDFLKRRA